MRVQNEGTGKSSWWMVNPDSSKSGKSSRRRASNPDNGKPAHYNFLNEVPGLCSDRHLVIVPPPLYIIHLPDDIEFLLLTFPSMHVAAKWPRLTLLEHCLILPYFDECEIFASIAHQM